jgi:segregation and condensation protein B
MKPLEQIIEACLFISSEPVTLAALAKAADASPDEVKAAVEHLSATFESRGLRLVSQRGKYLMVTAPELAPYAERLASSQLRPELSPAALETLAVIAYRQPVTKTSIDEIRGVASDQTLKNLLIRGLVEEAGQADSPGKPTLYTTSLKFLQHLGISSPDQLPRLN